MEGNDHINAEQFYDKFKDFLNVLGCGFNHKEQAYVFIKDGMFCMELNGIRTCVSLPTEAPNES